MTGRWHPEHDPSDQSEPVFPGTEFRLDISDLKKYAVETHVFVCRVCAGHSRFVVVRLQDEKGNNVRLVQFIPAHCEKCSVANDGPRMKFALQMMLDDYSEIEKSEKWKR